MLESKRHNPKHHGIYQQNYHDHCMTTGSQENKETMQARGTAIQNSNPDAILIMSTLDQQPPGCLLEGVPFWFQLAVSLLMTFDHFCGHPAWTSRGLCTKFRSTSSIIPTHVHCQTQLRCSRHPQQNAANMWWTCVNKGNFMACCYQKSCCSHLLSLPHSKMKESNW